MFRSQFDSFRDKQQKEYIYGGVFLCFSCVLLVPLLVGYGYGRFDHTVHLPRLYKIFGVANFSKDFGLDFIADRYVSGLDYVYLAGKLVNLGIAGTSLLVFVVSGTLLGMAYYLILSKYLGVILSIVVSLCLIVPKPMPGALLSFDIVTVSRTPALALLMLSVAGMIHSRLLLAAFFAGLSIWFQPGFGIGVGAVIGVYGLINFRRCGVLWLALGGLIYISFLLLSVSFFSSPNSSYFQMLDGKWMEIIENSSRSSFFLVFENKFWITYFLSIFLVGAFSSRRCKEKNIYSVYFASMCGAFVLSLFSLAAHFVLPVQFSIALVLQRILILPLLISVIISIVVCFESLCNYKRCNIWRLNLFEDVSLVFFFSCYILRLDEYVIWASSVYLMIISFNECSKYQKIIRFLLSVLLISADMIFFEDYLVSLTTNFSLGILIFVTISFILFRQLKCLQEMSSRKNLIFGGIIATLLGQQLYQSINRADINQNTLVTFDGGQWNQHQNALRSVGHWMKDNTHSDALILTFPDDEKLRIYAMRSLYFVPKDLSLAILDRNFALEMDRRREEVEKLQNIIGGDFPENEKITFLVDFVKNENIDFVLLPENSSLALPSVFRNETYQVIDVSAVKEKI
tara:strand:+ start:13233 stop:15116 length:1884 start_codon:yes stop_codon:yes gene_type:complete